MISVKQVSAYAAMLVGTLSLQACDPPPKDTVQTGYRGVGLMQISEPEESVRIDALNQLPVPIPSSPAVDGAPKARDVYKNVQVLGDLGVAEFTRNMVAITQWVSPVQGCTYCHVGTDMADDSLYTKQVARRMMQMTQAINTTWDSHVGATGVTCLTCHRGKNVPEYIWFQQDGPPTAGGMSGKSYQQNHAALNVGSTSMLSDPFSRYLNAEPAPIRVISQTALPLREPDRSASTTQQTEDTYSLMIHLSKSLGVNCTHCHNSRSFTAWDQSPSARTTAWHGLQMVPALNAEYLNPLQPVFPPERLGPLGDAPKINCATCHQNVSKPFNGMSMLEDYPVWRTVPQ